MPEIETRAAQPYVAIRTHATMADLGGLGARIADVFAWLGARDVAPAGAPFFRYRVIDMAADLQIDVGVPVETAVEGDDSMIADVLPAGQYATLIHVGHPNELASATGSLLGWASAQGLKFDMEHGDDGERWASRLEIYLTDPSKEPDMSKWVNQLAFLLA
jgi:effector-binding domain-containing protein